MNGCDQSKVQTLLRQVAEAAASNRNVMASIIEAVKAYAIVGEITKCLVEVYGRYEEPIVF